jgi:hypothetical protein
MTPRSPKSGRNDPCPCGSGRKYKKCCLAKDEALTREAAKAPLDSALQPLEGFLGVDSRSAVAGHPVKADAEENTRETQIPPAAESQLNQLWDNFEALKQPTVEQMDDFLAQLLTMPPDLTQWSDILHRFARLNHPDLPGVFRRIATTVPHSKATGMGFFYWAAAEEFTRHDLSDLLSEVAAGFRKLDVHSYDPDALSHVEAFLLAAGLEAETLQLAEYFLPIQQADDGLMPFAVPQRCHLIFELRVGEWLRRPPSEVPAPEILAKQFRKDIEEEIDEDTARLAVEIVTNRAPEPAWTRSQFDFVTGAIPDDDQSWRDFLRLFGMLLRVAREAWQIESQLAGCALHGLMLLLRCAYEWKNPRSAQSNKSNNNLLDYLRPSGLERRLVESSRGMIGIDIPRARLLLQAHELLAHFAARHQLLSSAETAQTEKELLRLRRALQALD